ncbi:MAG: flagellar hook-associated protein FlgL [Gammaproteobacteria bacterium]|nr:flagellar hook-associated protein FlgL [Gammaproteobacteria bacterium]
MRISSAQIYNSGLNALLDNQTHVNKTQLQLSTGRRILTPADDPAGSAEAASLTQAIDSTQQYQRNADMARGRLELEESTLGSVSDVLQRVRELAIQANNDSQTSQTRHSIALELRSLRSQLIELANTRDASGEYLFSGFKAKAQAFTETASGQVQYNGDQNTRYLQIGPQQTVADGEPGSSVFVDIRNGNGTFTTLDNPANSGNGIIDPGTVSNPSAYVAETYTIAFVTNGAGQLAYSVTGSVSGQLIPPLPANPVTNAPAYVEGAAMAFNGILTSVSGQPVAGDSFTISPSVAQDVFTTVENMAAKLDYYLGTASGMAVLHNTMNRGISDLDQAMSNVTDARARAGGRLNTVDGQKNANDVFLLQVQKSRSELQDLDYAEAASRLNRQMLALDAAQQTFVKVQGLSLFNYLR